MIFYDFEVFEKDWLAVFIDVTNKKEHVIINSPDKLKALYEANHIQYRMEGLDNITMITENRIDRNKAEVKDAEMNVQHWLYLRSQHKKGSNGYKHYMTNVKESRDTLKEKKADLRSAEKEYKDSIRDKEFFSKLLSEVFS